MQRWSLVNVDNFREMKHFMFMQQFFATRVKRKKYEVLHVDIKNNDNNNNKQVHLGTRIEAA